MRRLSIALALCGVAAHGADLPPDEEALKLADATRMEEEKPRDLKLLLEAAALSPQGGADSQRLSFDLRWDGRLSPVWCGTLANRLDWRFASAPQRNHGVNTLKEAYLSREFGADMMLDFGRVNTRYGVATGYNPTDFLGAGTVRSVVSADGQPAPKPPGQRDAALAEAMGPRLADRDLVARWAMGRTRTAPAWTGAPAILGSGYCWSVAIVSLKTSTRNGCCCKSRAARRNWASICRGCSAMPPSPTWNGPAAGNSPPGGKAWGWRTKAGATGWPPA